jgi:hypothetical protein
MQKIPDIYLFFCTYILLLISPQWVDLWRLTAVWMGPPPEELI